jgi:prevent-host-death family protein
MRSKAPVTELKARLSRYLSRVKAGEEVLVTERGRVVARLSPVAAGETGEEGLEELERQGLIRLGTGRLPEGFWKLPRPRDPEASVRRAVAEEREAGW